MNADPTVMEFFPAPLTFDQTVAFIAGIESGFEENGFGLWALALKSTGDFIGLAGLARPKFDASFTPCVEIAWRLDHRYWGNCYAPEAAAEVIKDGFERMLLPDLVSFTAVVNKKSIRVMEKLGIKRDSAGDFDNPRVPAGNPLKPHVLYRLSRQDWVKSLGG